MELNIQRPRKETENYRPFYRAYTLRFLIDPNTTLEALFPDECYIHI